MNAHTDQLNSPRVDNEQVHALEGLTASEATEDEPHFLVSTLGPMSHFLSSSRKRNISFGTF